MSIEPAGPRHYKVDKSATSKQAAINEIDVSVLQVDDTYGEDCDPYNSTGQHLVDAVREREREE